MTDGPSRFRFKPWRTLSRPVLASLLLLPPSMALADATLVGRTVTLNVLTYNDPGDPLFDGLLHTAQVGEEVEFGLGSEDVQNNVEVVPVLVDVGSSRVEIRYSESGDLIQSTFNGYVFRFDTDCRLFRGAKIDYGFTNMPLEDESASIKGNALFLNVAGLSYTRQSRIAVDLAVADCPVF